MRTGRRESIPAWAPALLLVMFAGAMPAEPRSAAGPTVEMAVEVDWSTPTAAGPTSADLAVDVGRIVEAVAWPSPGVSPRPRADGAWTLGDGSKGRIRARVEAPIGATLTVRVGGQAAIIPMALLLDGPQRLAAGPSSEVGVERLPWDSIRAELGGPGFDGTAEPGAQVPLSVSFGILTPEPAEVDLQGSAELRPIGGGEPVWRRDWREVVATDAASPPVHAMAVPAPGPEGTYVLEIKTSWEPVSGPSGSRLGRWLRRRRNPAATTSATRRMTLAVVAPHPVAAPAPSKSTDGAGVEVDAVDLSRSIGHRPTAAGRSMADAPGQWAWPVPEAALAEPNPRDRLLGWVGRVGGPDPSSLAPSDAVGLAWSAVGLRVARPGRPHRLTVTVTGGHPSALGVAMVATGGGRPRLVLDACASGPPILDGGPATTYSWPVWPDSENPSLILVNRSPSASVRVGSIAMVELVELAAAPPSALAERSVGLHLATARDLDRFGGGGDDPLSRARNLASYLAHIGASSVVLPDGLADRGGRRALSGRAAEDNSGPDRLDLILRALSRRGATAWVDVAFDGPLPGLPPAESPEALAGGLARVDRRGALDGPSYQPIHPEVRRSMARKVAEAVAARRTRPNLLGALVRLGPGSTLPGGPDSGLDDATYARFVAAAFETSPAARVPGQGRDDPSRFESRARFVEGPGRLAWLAWRSREVAAVYAGLAESARRAAPGATLAVVTPGLEPGPAGDEARRVDLAGLGPSQAWRGVGLDLAAWPSGDGAPILFRGAGLSTDDLGHDLATSPELDEQVAARAGRGVLLGVEATEADPTPGLPRLTARAMAEGPAGDEPLGHALAAIDARRVVLASTSAIGQEDRIRRFARAFTALPAPPTGPPGPRPPSGVVARSIRAGNETYLALANDTPYPILIETAFQAPATAPVDDLGRGVRLDPEKGSGTTRLVLELGPFGVASARVGSPDVRIVAIAPHPGPAVLDGMKAQFEDISTTLARLDRSHAGASAVASARSGPANPGFEPEAVQLAASRPPAAGVAGWELSAESGGAAAELDRDRPRSGRGSLRLDARGPSAAVASEPFRPEGRSALVIRAWFRADRPDARVRVRVDGQGANRSYARILDVPVRLDWSEATVRASGLPEGGLESARVRFELLGPGRLWIDDVAVAGDALGESERLNASRDLMAAVSAYREKRYADFARLAGSHWARHVAPGPAEAVAGDRSGLIRTGEASSALPPGNRLR